MIVREIHTVGLGQLVVEGTGKIEFELAKRNKKNINT